MRRPRLQIRPDRIAYPIHVGQLMIPESPRQNISSLQVIIPLRVVELLHRVTVTEAIEFQIVSRFGAEKIERVRTNTVLTAKLIAGETAIAQNPPRFSLRPR